jgi:hypothetical protein
MKTIEELKDYLKQQISAACLRPLQRETLPIDLMSAEEHLEFITEILDKLPK